MKNQKPKFLFGKKALIDAIENHVEIIKVNLLNLDSKTKLLLKRHSVNYQIQKKVFFNQFDSDLNHQFCVSEVKAKIPIFLNLQDSLLIFKEQKTSIVLILDSIQDSRNFGAILRTAEAFNVDCVYYKEHHQAQINDLVIKTAMGATNYLNLVQINNLTNLIEKLKQENFWIYATALTKTAKAYNLENYPEKIALIIGNEDKGVSQNLQNNADFLIYIPMYGNVQSLNVSVATGILLAYFRQIKTLLS